MPVSQDRPWTPGPWHLGKPDRKGSDAHLCEVMTEYATPNDPKGWPMHYMICRTWSPERLEASVRIDQQTCMANAHLIAAAPELFEALIAMVSMKPHPWECECAACSKARNALSKALGERP